MNQRRFDLRGYLTFDIAGENATVVDRLASIFMKSFQTTKRQQNVRYKEGPGGNKAETKMKKNAKQQNY